MTVILITKKSMNRMDFIKVIKDEIPFQPRKGHLLTACNKARPHRLPHLTACLIQNGRGGLEKCQSLDFWIPRTTFAKKDFGFNHSFYENLKSGEKNGENCSPLTSLPVALLISDRLQRRHSCQKSVSVLHQHVYRGLEVLNKMLTLEALGRESVESLPKY